MIGLILATALVQAPDPCHAIGGAPAASGCPQWRLIAREAEAELFVDPASLRPGGSTFDITTRIVYAAARQAGMRSGVTVTHFDCAHRTWALGHSAYFDARGALIVEGDATGEDAAPETVPDDGPFADILTEFCPSPAAAEGRAPMPAPAQAADPCQAVDAPAGQPNCPPWQLIDRGDGAAWFADPTTVHRSGDGFEIRARLIAPARPSDPMRSAVILFGYDCVRRTSSTRQITAYDASGARLPDQPLSGVADPVPDNSFGSVMLARYCPH